MPPLPARISVASGRRFCRPDAGGCCRIARFVAAHRRLAEPGWFVTGTRILLSADLTDRILHQGLEPELWGFASWLVQRSRQHLNRFAPLLELRLGVMRKLSAKRWRGARGSNMAFWRADLEKVDGFDSSFRGWGREDSDIFIRLIRAGVRRKDGRFACGVMHLWHPEADRSHLPENERKLDAAVRGDRVRALRGLSDLCSADAHHGPKNHPQSCEFSHPRTGSEMPGGVAP